MTYGSRRTLVPRVSEGPAFPPTAGAVLHVAFGREEQMESSEIHTSCELPLTVDTAN